MKKGIIGLVVILLVILFVVSQKDTNEDKLTVVKFGDLPVTQALPFYYAIEKGYFTEAGINMKRVRLDSPNLIIDALLSGQVDLTSPSGAMGIAGVATVKQPGSLQVYAGAGADSTKDIRSESVYVVEDSPIKNLEDLKGKSIGILPGIQWRTITRHMFAQAGIDIDVDSVSVVDLAPGLQLGALMSGQIDALLAIEPIATIADIKGLEEIVPRPNTRFVSDPFFPGAGIVRTEFIQENPELFETILEITDRSINEINADYDLAKPYLKGYTTLTDDLVDQAPFIYWKTVNTMNERDIKGIEDFHAIFHTYGVVDTPIKTREILYESKNK